jgi:hypothetical protein
MRNSVNLRIISVMFRMSSGRPIAPNDTIMPTNTSRDMKFYLISDDSTTLGCSKMYASRDAKCYLSFSHVLQASGPPVIPMTSGVGSCEKLCEKSFCGICSSALSREINFF